MENVTEYLNKVALEKQATALLKASYNTNESSVGHLLHHDSNRYATGKLAEYERLLKICKFKLTVYWTYNKWGVPYTVEQKMKGENRRPIPSVDQVGKVYNEETGFLVLVDKVLKQCARMDSAQIYLIDKVAGLEHMVVKFNTQNMILTDHREMEFKTNEHGRRYFVGMVDQPIRTDKIRIKS